jgi:hypothetical protein
MLKYLRIAVTALSLAACVLLVAIWVRSYFRWDSPHGPFLGNRWIQLNSLQGHLFIGIHERDSLGSYGSYVHWNWRTFRLHRLRETGATGTVAWPFDWRIGALGFGVVETNGLRSVFLPYWFLVLITIAVAAAACWKSSWQFSLRTLLIVTTLVAVLLGIGAMSN